MGKVFGAIRDVLLTASALVIAASLGLFAWEYLTAREKVAALLQERASAVPEKADSELTENDRAIRRWIEESKRRTGVK
jgi:hypothetical protein